MRDGVNLLLPSGNSLAWGNQDFDVNLAITNPAFDKNGQLFFDIFDTDGFLGDILAVNGNYYPYFEVLPRRYRFRILNASMARFIKLAVAVNKSRNFSDGTTVPIWFIANDGNLVVNPLQVTQLEEQGVAERYDIVIDFSAFVDGDSLYLVNLLQQTDGGRCLQVLCPCRPPSRRTRRPMRRPDSRVPSQARWHRQRGRSDPDLYRHGDRRQCRLHGVRLAVRSKGADRAGAGRRPRAHPCDRVRPLHRRFARSEDGQCIPECGTIEAFPWTIKIKGRRRTH